MRVLGVDPGLTRCGVGVVEGVAGRPLTMLGVGVVRTAADDDIGVRLVGIERGIEEWLDRFSPELVAVERVFSQHNVRTVMGTAQASAVAMLCASRRGIPVALHTPSEVKAAVTGSGRADKAQVGAMVTRLLRLSAPPKPADAADALALAICHIWRAPAQNRLQQAVAENRLQQAVARQAAAVKAEPDDRLRQRPGRRARPHHGRHRGRRRGHGGPVHPGDPRGTPDRRGRPARDLLVVREDSLTLYGFADDDERQVFELLQTASGVGPRLAQAMLGVHSPDALRLAVSTGDEKALMAVPGIGKKGAQKLLLELKDKLGAPLGSSGMVGAQRAAASGPAPWTEQLSAALIGLGYASREAEEAVAAVAPQAEEAIAAGGSAPVPQLLRAALQSLNRAR